MMITDSNEAKINWSKSKQFLRNNHRGVMVTCRGEKCDDPLLTELLSNPLIYKDNINMTVVQNGSKINGIDKSLSLAVNNDFMNDYLDFLTVKVGKMMTERVYLHQYEKFGMSGNDFKEAIAMVEQIKYDYSI